MLKEHRSLACVEVLGRSVLDRTLDRLKASGVTAISVLGVRHSVLEQRSKPGFRSVSDVWQTATKKIVEMSQRRLDAVLIMALGGYIEFNPADLVQFQQEQGAAVVRACNEDGELPVWLIDPSQLPLDADLKNYLRARQPVLFEARMYTNHLENPQDLRRLVVDGLTSRCSFRPAGFEVKPGIWMGPAAQVESGARIVAPAFIGQAVRVAHQCLITRCSDLEGNSQVDYGTVVEDSSVLSDTYVGIGLDLSHSIVDGNYLANLRHDVTLEISDPAILRRVNEGRTRTDAGRRFLASFDFEEGAASSASTIRR
jgi:NDP-sugar pyrophosphorylase family protein